jgi:hypothetical protein
MSDLKFASEAEAVQYLSNFTGKRILISKKLELISSDPNRYTKNYLLMDISKDEFIHFTTRSRAEEIVKAKKLLMNPPYSKFGTDTVDAVSTTYGKLTPSVQINHISKHTGDEDIVAILFKTKTKPDYGVVEEVKWKQDVDLISPKIISKEDAEQRIKNTPEKIDDMDDMVFYDKESAKE